MNKKDIDNLGFILSDSNSIAEISQRIFDLDARIEESFNEYEEASGRSEAVEELFSQIMIERYGNTWSYSTRTPKTASAEVLTEVRKEIYGDDYDYIFNRQ